MHTAGIPGMVRRGVKKASNYVKGKNPTIEDMEAKLAKLEDDLATHRETAKGSTGAKQKAHSKLDDDLTRKIKDTDLMLRKMKQAKANKADMDGFAEEHKKLREGKVHHYPQKTVQHGSPNTPIPLPRLHGENNMHSFNHHTNYSDPRRYDGMQPQRGGVGGDDDDELRSVDPRSFQSLPVGNPPSNKDSRGCSSYR